LATRIKKGLRAQSMIPGKDFGGHGLSAGSSVIHAEDFGGHDLSVGSSDDPADSSIVPASPPADLSSPTTHHMHRCSKVTASFLSLTNIQAHLCSLQQAFVFTVQCESINISAQSVTTAESEAQSLGGKIMLWSYGKVHER